MSDLVVFLRARLGEDEQMARAATPGPWDADEDEVCTLHDGEGGDLVGDTVAYVRRRSEDTAHIARHDPQRVLREVEAKEWLLRRHSKRRSPNFDYPGHIGWECAQCTNEYPCPTLAVLVLPYAGHPDYRREWHPDLA